MKHRVFALAVWYEIPGKGHAHAVLLPDQPFQRLSPSEALEALCGVQIPEGSPVQFDTDFHDCAACRAAMAKGA